MSVIDKEHGYIQCQVSMLRRICWTSSMMHYERWFLSILYILNNFFSFYFESYFYYISWRIYIRIFKCRRMTIFFFCTNRRWIFLLCKSLTKKKFALVGFIGVVVKSQTSFQSHSSWVSWASYASWWRVLPLNRNQLFPIQFYFESTWSMRLSHVQVWFVSTLLST